MSWNLNKRRLSMLLMSFMLATGCGQLGPLYLPEPAVDTDDSESEAAAEEDTQKESS